MVPGPRLCPNAEPVLGSRFGAMVLGAICKERFLLSSWGPDYKGHLSIEFLKDSLFKENQCLPDTVKLGSHLTETICKS